MNRSRGEAAALVGRHEVIGLLERALAAAAVGRAQHVVLVGEPGIGKTALIRELCRRAEGRALILAGSVAAGAPAKPYALVIDALDDWIGSLEREQLEEQLGAERLAELRAVFPSLSRRGGDRPDALGAEWQRCHHAVRRLLEDVGARELPLVLALDGVDGADRASLELIAHLVRRGGHVLVVLAYRPAAAPAGLRSAIDAAARDEALVIAEPAPLSEAEADELLGPGVEPATRAVLLRASGGNPFYLRELSGLGPRALAALADPEPDQPKVVPPGITAALAAELERLAPEARALLQAASVAGDPFDVDLAVELAGLNEPAGLRLLDELIASDLVRETSATRRLAFRHPIARLAVYEATDRTWRRAAHARAAQALARRDAPPWARAEHLARSAGPGDEEAIALLREAGELASARDPAAAAQWFAAALRLVSEDAQPGRRRELLLSLGAMRGAEGRLEESRAALEAALPLIGPDDGERRAHVATQIAQHEHLLGRDADARARLTAALDALPDRRSPEATALKLQLAYDHWMVGEWGAMQRCASEALEAAPSAEAGGVHVQAAGLLGLALAHRGDIAGAHRAIDEGSRSIEQLDDEELAARLGACFWLGVGALSIERLDEAGRQLERGLVIARATGRDAALVPLLAARAHTRIWQGRLAEAGEDAQAAAEGALALGNAQYRAWAEVLRTWSATRRGDLEMALSSGRAAVELSRHAPRGRSAGLAYCALGEALVEAGEPARGIAEILEHLGGAGLPGEARAFRVWWYELLTRAELARGRVADATRWADRAAASVAGVELDGRRAFALRARAAALAAAGRPGPAAARALAAAERFRRTGIAAEAARATLLAGQSLAAGGDGERAALVLERAHAELDSLGAARAHAEAARALRTLTGPARRFARPPAEALDGLTGREREVSALVAAGHSNREVATRLLISEKTVENHLARAFGKLDVGSRAQLAAVFERHGVGSEPP
jgi:DNA-binding NarL/FixJ family response regulator